MQSSGAADRVLETLRAKGLIYQGTLEAPKGETSEDWEPVELTLFRSTQFGDDQDRPMKKSDGSWTYFGADAAYHLQKAEKADGLINIWGADHAGTVKRIQAAVSALTDGRVELDVKLVQMVRLFRAGEPVKMSKRSGSFVTLADVVNEVGKDVVRFMMLTRRADAPLDFDFAKVVEASKDNPVFYVQYAHARISSLHRKAKAEGIDLGIAPNLDLLDEEELALVKLAAQFPRVVEAAALAHEPHRIAFYLGDLAAAFHQQWNKGNDDPIRRFLLIQNVELTRARLELASAIGQIVRNGLGIMGLPRPRRCSDDRYPRQRSGSRRRRPPPLAGSRRGGRCQGRPRRRQAHCLCGDRPARHRPGRRRRLLDAQPRQRRHRSGGEPEMIAAPEGDYKVKPDEPGGMKVEGKGDTAYAASEGADPKGVINVDAAPEAPVTAAPKQQPAPTPAPAAPKQQAPLRLRRPHPFRHVRPLRRQAVPPSSSALSRARPAPTMPGRRCPAAGNILRR